MMRPRFYTVKLHLGQGDEIELPWFLGEHSEQKNSATFTSANSRLH